MGYHFGPRADKIRQEGNTPIMPALLQNSVAVGVLIHNMMALQHGMQVVMMAKYDFETLTRYSAEYRLSVFFLAPSIWNRIVNEWQVGECKNIRWAMSGGSPLSLVLQKRVNNVLTAGTYLLPNWGMTELVCGATQMNPDEVDDEGSVGRLVPRMEAMVIGDLGQSLPSGQSGELVVKGKYPGSDKWFVAHFTRSKCYARILPEPCRDRAGVYLIWVVSYWRQGNSRCEWESFHRRPIQGKSDINLQM
jgi:acyl-CoA synthetase (AMP-forming)/AMP-acid ligase II